jgi:hypothetical protein
MTLAVQTVSNPEVLRIPLASTTGGAATDTLLICTGIAVFDFSSGTFGTNKNTLIFALPDENGSPLSIAPARLVNSAATASPSSFKPGAGETLFAVDRVDISQSDAEEGQIFLNADLVVGGIAALFRIAYQVNLLVRANSSPPGS